MSKFDGTAYFRVKRDGKFQNLALEELTPDELGQIKRLDHLDDFAFECLCYLIHKVQRLQEDVAFYTYGMVKSPR